MFTNQGNHVTVVDNTTFWFVRGNGYAHTIMVEGGDLMECLNEYDRIYNKQYDEVHQMETAAGLATEQENGLR